MTYTFARIKLDQESGFEQVARERWRQYYLKLIQDSIVRNEPDKRYWNVLVSDKMQTIEEEWHCIEEVLKWANEQHQDKLLLDLVMLLAHYIDIHFLNLQRMMYVKKAIDIAQKLQLKEDEALLRLDALGWTFVEEGQLDQAYQEIILGINLAEQLDVDIRAKADLVTLGYAWKARVMIEQGYSEPASELIKIALSSSCSPWIESRVYMAAGDISLKIYLAAHEKETQQERSNEALNYYLKQEEIMDSYGGEGHGYQVLPRLGLAYIGTGEIEKAEEIFKALKDNKNIPIGEIYGDYGMALVTYKRNLKEEALRLRIDTKDTLLRKTTSNGSVISTVSLHSFYLLALLLLRL